MIRVKPRWVCLIHGSGHREGVFLLAYVLYSGGIGAPTCHAA
jgi:hypothetical protein